MAILLPCLGKIKKHWNRVWRSESWPKGLDDTELRH